MDIKDIVWPTEIEYTPPAALPKGDEVPVDSLFICRKAAEDSMREVHFWTVWAEEVGLFSITDVHSRPDSTLAFNLAELVAADSGRLLDILTTARGNWGNIFRFLTGVYPSRPVVSKITDRAGRNEALSALAPDVFEIKLALLETLTKKDLRDIPLEALEDHFNHTTLEMALDQKVTREYVAMLDSVDRKRYLDYVVTPRINYEPSSAWRGFLCDFFQDNPRLVSSKHDKALLKWLRKNITLAESSDRLGSSLSPDLALKLRRGTSRDMERLYVGLCRVRGIPVRFNPTTGELERWDGGVWIEVKVSPGKSDSKKTVHKGKLIIEVDPADSIAQEAQYFKAWTVQRWETDHGADVDFGYEKPYKNVIWPQELSPGLYCLTSGFRREDGSAPLSLTWFEIKPGEETLVTLLFRERDK